MNQLIMFGAGVVVGMLITLFFIWYKARGRAPPFGG